MHRILRKITKNDEQKKLITFKNKEKALDCLVSITRELEDLYIQYWGSATQDFPKPIVARLCTVF
jgi:translation initiation factor 2 alpha subunit (eIF-2alpha)